MKRLAFIYLCNAEIAKKETSNDIPWGQMCKGYPCSEDPLLKLSIAIWVQSVSSLTVGTSLLWLLLTIEISHFSFVLQLNESSSSSKLCGAAGTGIDSKGWSSCGTSDVEDNTHRHAFLTKADEFPSFDLGFWHLRPCFVRDLVA